MKMKCIIINIFKSVWWPLNPSPPPAYSVYSCQNYDNSGRPLRTCHVLPRRMKTYLNEDTDTEAGEHEEPDNGGRVDGHVVHHLTDTHLSIRQTPG